MKTSFKSILNVTWKVAVAIIGVFFLIGVIEKGVDYLTYMFGRAPWGDEALSKTITARRYRNGRMKVYDSSTGEYTTGKLLWVSSRPKRDSLTVYCDKDFNRGYINCNTGKIAIAAGEAQFKRAWHFSEGYALVVLKDEDSLSIIDHAGKVIARNVAYRHYNYDYVFANGVCQVYDENSYMTGFIRTDGTWAIEMNYFYIDCPNTDGYRIAHNAEGYWLFDKNCNQVFPEPYEMIDFAIGLTEADVYLTKDHVKVLATYDGKVVEPFVIDGTYDLHYVTKYNEDDADEYALDPDLLVYRVDSWEGLMDKHTGKVLTPAKYTDMRMISKDLIMAELDNGYEDYAVIMDRRGRIIKQ